LNGRAGHAGEFPEEIAKLNSRGTGDKWDETFFSVQLKSCFFSTKKQK
jgi:hypothetical protein